MRSFNGSNLLNNANVVGGSGSGGGGVNLGDWDASTNTPTLPNPPTSPEYAIGEYYEVTVAGTQFGFTFTVGDFIVVRPNGGALAWNKESNSGATGMPGGAVNTLQFNLDNINFGGILNSSVDPLTGTVTLASLALGSTGLDLNNSGPIDFFNSNSSSRFSIYNSSVVNGVSVATISGANSYNFDTIAQAADLITTNVKNAVSLATDADGKIIEGTGGGAVPIGPNGAIQFYTDGVLNATGRFEYDNTSSTLILASPDNNRFATFHTTNGNNLVIGNINELNIDAGLRSTQYITCPDIYISNANTGNEVHQFLSDGNNFTFTQSLGTGVKAKFEMDIIVESMIQFVNGADQAQVLLNGSLTLTDNNNIHRFAVYNGGVSVLGDNAVGARFNLYNFDNSDAIVFENTSVSTGNNNLTISGASTYAITDGQFIAEAARFNNNVQFYAEGIFYNPDASGSIHISNTGATGVNELSFYFASAYKFDAPVHTPAIWDDIYGLAFDVVNRQLFAYDGTMVAQLNGGVAPGVLIYQGLYFPNVDETATAYITSPGSLSVNSLHFRGADDYDFDNNVLAPSIYENTGGTIVFDLVTRDWFDSLGATQIQVVDGFVKLPTLAAGTQTALVGVDVDNQLVSVSLSDFATAAQGATADTALQSGDIIADIIPILISGTALNGSYFLTQKAKFAGTITAFSGAAASLTTAGTYTVAINGTPVTGLDGVTNTTTSTETNATAANAFVVDDIITITFAGTLTLVNFEGQLSLTRAL